MRSRLISSTIAALASGSRQRTGSSSTAVEVRGPRGRRGRAPMVRPVDLLPDQVCRRPQRSRRRRRQRPRGIAAAGWSSCAARSGPSSTQHFLLVRSALARDPGHPCRPRQRQRRRRSLEYLAPIPRDHRRHYLCALPARRPPAPSSPAGCARPRVDLLLRRRGRRGRGVRFLDRLQVMKLAVSLGDADAGLAPRPRPPIPACRMLCARDWPHRCTDPHLGRHLGAPRWQRRPRRWREQRAGRHTRRARYLTSGHPMSQRRSREVPDGWLVTLDNITFRPKGRAWICTDGANDFDLADGSMPATRPAKAGR